MTVSRFVPRALISASSPDSEDAESPSTATIAATPIAMPSADREARNELAGAQADRRDSPQVRRSEPDAIEAGRHRHGPRPSVHRLRQDPAKLSATICPSSISIWRGRRSAIPRSWVMTQDGRSLIVKRLEELEDGLAGGAVEVSGRLVGKQNRRVSNEGSGDRDALAFSSGKLRRTSARSAVSGRPVRARPLPVVDVRRARRLHRAARRRRCRVRTRARPGRTAGRRSRSRVARSADSSRSDISATSSPVTRTIPQLGRSSVPIRWSSVVFPEPGRSDDRDELAAADREAHSPQCLDGRLARIDLPHVVDFKHGARGVVGSWFVLLRWQFDQECVSFVFRGLAPPHADRLQGRSRSPGRVRRRRRITRG